MIYYDLKSILTALQLDFFTTGGSGRRQMIGRKQDQSQQKCELKWCFFYVVLADIRIFCCCYGCLVWTVCESKERRKGGEYLYTLRQKEQSGHMERHITARSGLGESRESVH